MSLTFEVPDAIHTLGRAVEQAGGRAFLVGGSVRDHLTGVPTKDWDVEVFGLPEDDLERLLRRHGRIDAVGRSFGVYKLRPRGWRDGREIDVSIPRRDSKVGPGHRGIDVVGDPDMSVREAARRRDLTVNAILWDIVARELLDPWDGLKDIQDRVLRAVDEQTFLEDPLRALRVVQFAARLAFTPTEPLLQICRNAALDELPAERIRGEWEKLLFKSARPSVGLQVARQADILARVFPEAAASEHPSVDLALDRAAQSMRTLNGRGRQWALMLSAWLHRASQEAVSATLDRIRMHRVERYDTRASTTALVLHYRDSVSSHADLRWLATRVEVDLALHLRAATGHDIGDARTQATALDILHEPMPPFLRGKDVLAAGVAPGPEVGDVLARVYRAQLDGDVTTPREALAMVQQLCEGREGRT